MICAIYGAADWGVERLFGSKVSVLDRAPAYGKGIDVVNRRSRGTTWTDLEKVSYENQPDKDPVGWTDDSNWSVFRRMPRTKLITNQHGKQYSFYIAVAPAYFHFAEISSFLSHRRGKIMV